MVVIGESENVLGIITAIRYPLLRHLLLPVPYPGLPSSSPDVSCSNPLAACPLDLRGLASFPRDHFACCYIPVSDNPLFRGSKFCNNDTTSNFVSHRTRFGFPTTWSIARRVYVARFARVTPTIIVSVISPFASSKWITWDFSRIVRCALWNSTRFRARFVTRYFMWGRIRLLRIVLSFWPTIHLFDYFVEFDWCAVVSLFY
jgi:hypothetical protein